MIREQVIDRTTLSLSLSSFFVKWSTILSHIWHENVLFKSLDSGIHAGGEKWKRVNLWLCEMRIKK